MSLVTYPSVLIGGLRVATPAYCHPLNSKQLVARSAESNCLLARNKSSQLKKCSAFLVHVNRFNSLQLAMFASAKHLNTCPRPGSMHPNGRPPGRTELWTC